MAEILYTGCVTTDNIQQVVADCHFAQGALFLAESFPTHIVTSREERQNLLRFTPFESTLSCAAYTSGRIFQQDRELRWEKQEHEIRVIYIGPEENGAALHKHKLEQSKELELASLKRSDQLKYYYLFGERLRPEDLKKLENVAQPGDFAVVRIPRILRYPVPQNERRYTRLGVCEYLEPATGRVALFRFQSLEAVE